MEKNLLMELVKPINASRGQGVTKNTIKQLSQAFIAAKEPPVALSSILKSFSQAVVYLIKQSETSDPQNEDSLQVQDCFDLVSCIFKLYINSEHSQLLQVILPQLIQLLPRSIHTLVQFPNPQIPYQLLAQNIEKKSLGNRERFAKLQALKECIKKQNLAIDYATVQSLCALAVSLDQPEAIKTEARQCLIQISFSHRQQLLMALKDISGQLGNAVREICNLDDNEQPTQSIPEKQITPNLLVYGVLPIELVEELQLEKDSKRKEQLSDEVLFIVETLDVKETELLSQYVDSFIKFLLANMLSDGNLKVIRVGLRLLYFLLSFVEDLATRTNVMHFIANLIEQFNESQGKNIVRQELQQLFLLVSHKVPLRILLLGLLNGIYKVQKDGQPHVLKTFILVILYHGKRKQDNGPYKDRQFLMAQVNTLVDLMQNGTPFMRNLATEAVVALSKCIGFLESENEVHEAILECNTVQGLYETFCDRLEQGDFPKLASVERRSTQNLELRLPYLDRLETQAITQKQKLSSSVAALGQSGNGSSQLILLKQSQIRKANPAQYQEARELITDKLQLLKKRRNQPKALRPLPNINQLQVVPKMDQLRDQVSDIEGIMFDDGDRSLLSQQGLRNSSQGLLLVSEDGDSVKAPSRKLAEAVDHEIKKGEFQVESSLSVVQSKKKPPIGKPQRSETFKLKRNQEIKTLQAQILDVAVNIQNMKQQPKTQDQNDRGSKMQAKKVDYISPAMKQKKMQLSPIKVQDSRNSYVAPQRKLNFQDIQISNEDDMEAQSESNFILGNSIQISNDNFVGKRLTQKSPRLTPRGLSLIKKMNSESSGVQVEESSQIHQLGNPKLDYEQCLKNFKSADWEQQVAALKVLRSLIQYQPELVKEDHLPKLLEFSESLRSGLSKLSLKTLNDFVQVFDLADKECHDVARLCIRKVGEANNFIQTGASECLQSLTQKYPQSVLKEFLTQLFGNNNNSSVASSFRGNNHIASGSKLLIAQCVEGAMGKFQAQPDLFQVVGALLQDKDPDVRHQARLAVVHMKNIPQAEELIKKNIKPEETTEQCLAILKTGNTQYEEISPRKLRKNKLI